MDVDPSNAEQLRAWDGDEGSYWAAHADHFDRSLAAYDDAYYGAAAVQAEERVLDVGCGTGKVARDLARRAPGGDVLGVDLSSAMLEVARGRAADEGLTNVTFEQADAQVHPFASAAYDLVVSRTAAMFFGDKPAAFRNLGQALRPGGRLVLLTWQPLSENEWLREFAGAMAPGRQPPSPPPDAPGPFSLSDPNVVRSLLLDTGYGEVTIDGVADLMWFGADADDAFGLVLGLLGWMLDGLDEPGRRAAVDALRTTIAAHEAGDGVLFRSGAWLTSAVRQ